MYYPTGACLNFKKNKYPILIDIPFLGGEHSFHSADDGGLVSLSPSSLLTAPPHFALQYFSDLRNSIVNSQPPEKQQAMHLCFENLMEGIERNLLTKNRDR